MHAELSLNGHLKLYHNSSMRRFLLRKHRGEAPIHYGLDFDVADSAALRRLVDALNGILAGDKQSQAASPPDASTTETPDAPTTETRRAPRPFNPAQALAPFVPSEQREDPEEMLARREKATQEHRDLLVALHQRLVEAGWTNIQEIASSVDLWATNPADRRRVIFEALDA